MKNDIPVSDEAKQLQTPFDEEEQTDNCQYEEPKVKKQALFLKISVFFWCGLAVISLIIRLALSGSPATGEAFYRYITRPLQAIMAALTSFIPFSLAETFVVLLLPVAIFILIRTAQYFIKRDSYRLIRTLLIITSVCGFIFTSYILNLSMLYCRPSLSELSGISDKAPSKEELYTASLLSVIKLDTLLKNGNFAFTENGASVCPYSFSELDEKITLAYEKYAKNNDWISPYGAKSKIISLSGLMTYTHIAGMYTPYTGESNININYPEYIVASTIAHEKAHQRGIGPEDEANLVAFFVLAESGDPYLEYCGYMSVFYELMEACCIASPEFYSSNVLPFMPKEIAGEFDAYSEFFSPYRKSTASKVAGTVNDTHLKLNGQSDGIKSYGMTVDMAVAYLWKISGLADS